MIISRNPSLLKQNGSVYLTVSLWCHRGGYGGLQEKERDVEGGRKGEAEDKRERRGEERNHL